MYTYLNKTKHTSLNIACMDIFLLGYPAKCCLKGLLLLVCQMYNNTLLGVMSVKNVKIKV